MIGDIGVHDEMVQKAFAAAPGVMTRTMDRYLGKAAMVMTRAVQRELRDRDSIVFTTLLLSIHAETPFAGARDVKAGVKYARYVEEGTKPGYRGLPPTRPLAEWMRIRFNLTEREAKSRAFGLARFIQIHGTKAHPFFRPAYDKTQSRLFSILRDGAAEGVRQALGVRDHYALTRA